MYNKLCIIIGRNSLLYRIISEYYENNGCEWPCTKSSKFYETEVLWVTGNELRYSATANRLHDRYKNKLNVTIIDLRNT